MPADPAIDRLTEDLRVGLLRVSRRLRREAHRAGLSALDAHILGMVLRHPGAGVCDLADREQMSRPAMSNHVKRLVEAGWLARLEPSEEDRRRSGLALTKAGQKALDEIRRARNDWLAARLAALTPDERSKLADAAGPLLRLIGEKA